MKKQIEEVVKMKVGKNLFDLKSETRVNPVNKTSENRNKI